MRDDVLTNGCERARNWASLSLDGELSELERRLLGAHLARCASCAAFAIEVEDIVTELRGTPQEQMRGGLPSLVWGHRPATPAIRVVSRIAAVAAAAAAGIAMFSLGAGSVDPREPAPGPQPIILDASGSDTMEEVATFRELRRGQLMTSLTQPVDGSHSGDNPL